MFDLKEIFSVTLILFLRHRYPAGPFPSLLSSGKRRPDPCRKGHDHFGSVDDRISFSGSEHPKLFGLDVASFAVAGAIVIFIVSMEMVLGVTLIKDDPDAQGSGSIVPLAFPLIAGARNVNYHPVDQGRICRDQQYWPASS